VHDRFRVPRAWFRPSCANAISGVQSAIDIPLPGASRSEKGYGESMPAPEVDEDLEPPEAAWASRARARQWRRAALALAFLFASLPLSGKLFLGSWRFDGALDMACLCLVAAAYLYFVGRESLPPIPDSAAILDEALRLAASGETGRGLALLDEALRLSPGLWQARQYRGEMHLAEPDAEAALKDFTEAIRLAPGEPHLYILRSHVFTMLGRDSSAHVDLEAAARLSGSAGTQVDGS
jgi:tetratricopeptide (TPR) repeat protein